MTKFVFGNLKKINNILTKEQNQILEAAAWLMIPIFLTKISGQLFNLIAASYFGINDRGWENFQLANSIPELFTNVFLMGAVGSVVIPTLIMVLNKEKKDYFDKVYSSIINVSLIVFTAAAIVVSLTAKYTVPFIIEQIIKPFELPSQGDYESIITLMSALMIPQIILGVSVFVSSGIKLYNRFLITQIAPLFYNIGRILAVIFLVPLMNYSPWAMVIGTIIGALLHLAIQLPLFNMLNLKYTPVIKWNDKYLHEILILSTPRMFALSSEHIAFTFNKFLAYGFNGLSAFNYANAISLVIPSMFGATFSEASYPTLSTLFHDNKIKEMKVIIHKTLNEILYLSLPFTVIFMVLRVPITRLAFGLLPDTKFDLDATYLVAWIILWFSIGWVFVSGRWFMYRLYYVVKDTVTPLLVSSLGLILMISLSYAFTNFFSYNKSYAVFDSHISFTNFFSVGSDTSVAVGGLALAMSIVYSIEFFIMIIIFNYKKFNLDFKTLINDSLKKFLAGGLMLGITYGMYKTWNALSYALPDRAETGYIGSTTINLLILTSITVFTGFSVYYLSSRLLNIEEVRIFNKILRPLFKLRSRVRQVLQFSIPQNPQ